MWLCLKIREQHQNGHGSQPWDCTEMKSPLCENAVPKSRKFMHNSQWGNAWTSRWAGEVAESYLDPDTKVKSVNSVCFLYPPINSIFHGGRPAIKYLPAYRPTGYEIQPSIDRGDPGTQTAHKDFALLGCSVGALGSRFSRSSDLGTATSQPLSILLQCSLHWEYAM